MTSSKVSGGLVEVGVILFAFILLWFAPAYAGDYAQQIAFRTLIYLTLAEGWNLMAGSAGLRLAWNLMLRRVSARM